MSNFNNTIIDNAKNEVRRLLGEIGIKKIYFNTDRAKENEKHTFAFRMVEITDDEIKVEYFRKENGFQILSLEHLATQEDEVLMWVSLVNKIVEYCNTWWVVEFDLNRGGYLQHFIFRFYIGTKAYGYLTAGYTDKGGTSWKGRFDLECSSSSRCVSGTPFSFGVNIIDGWFNGSVVMDTLQINKFELSSI